MADDAKKPVQTTIKKIIKTPLIKRIKAPAGAPVAPPAGGAPVPPKPVVHTPDAAATEEPPLPPEDSKKEPAAPAGKDAPQGRAPAARAEKNDAEKDKKAEKNDKNKKNKKPFYKTFMFKVLAVFAGFIGVCYGVYAYLPVLAEKKIPELFAANGMKLRSFKVNQITISEMNMSNISDASGMLTVSSMKLKYSLLDLLNKGKLNSLTVSGMTLSGVRRDDSVSLGILPQLVSSSANVKKGMELDIPKIEIRASSFVLRRETENPKTDEDGNPINENITVSFTGSGSFSSKGQTFRIETSSDTPQAKLKTETNFTKNKEGTSVVVKITEGEIRNAEQAVGTVEGTLETHFVDGTMTKGTADLAMLTPDETMKLKTEITPVNESFNIFAHFERNIEDKNKARGKFVGNFDIESEGLQVSGTFQKFGGVLPVKISAASLKNGSVAVNNLKISAAPEFSCEDAKCTFRLKTAVPVAFDSAEMMTTFRRFSVYKPVVFNINPDPREIFLETDGGNLFMSLPLSDFIANIFMSDPVSSRQFGVMLKSVKTHIRSNVFSGAFGGDFTFDQSIYADPQIKMSGFQGAFSFASGVLPTGRFRVQMMESKIPDTFPPVSMDFSVKPMGRSEIGFTTQVQLQSGKATFSADGSFDLPTHTWNMYVNVPKINLSETGLPLESVAPFLNGILSPKTSGGITAKGRLSIANGKATGPLRLLLDNVSTEWKGVKFSGISGLMTLSGIKPLETPDNQLLYIGMLSSGIPFDNVQANYRIVANQGVQVLNLGLHFAGGQFRTIRPFFYPYDGQPSLLMMEGSGLDLSEMADALRSSALAATGTMNSEWTISFGEKGLNIDSAKLMTRLPGTMHFTPAADVKRSMSPKEVEFLKDVIVKKMGIGIEGPMTGVLNFKIKVQGRSPLAETDTNFGYDFKANFKTLLKDVVKPANIPSDVLLQIQSFEK